MNRGEHKSALVLSGGGAYGAYEVGVIKALFEGKCASTAGRPLDPDVFVGTSAGSFNAAVLAINQGGARGSIRRLEQIWQNDIADNDDGRGNGVYRIRGNPASYVDPRLPGTPVEQLESLLRDTLSLGRAAVPRMERLWALAKRPSVPERLKCLVDISAFLNVEPFQRLIEKSIAPHALRKSPKVLSVTATNWATGMGREFDFSDLPPEKGRLGNEEVWACIRASTAIPGLFPPVNVGGEPYVDGGVVLNTPLGNAIDAGATDIHVISLDPDMRPLPRHHIENTVDTFGRVYTAMLTAKITEDIESARWINEGIDVLERVHAAEEVDDAAMRRFVRVAGVIHRRLSDSGKLPSKVTIHHYYPSRPLGDMLGMLNFERAAIDSMIDLGYRDACTHKCRKAGKAGAVRRICVGGDAEGEHTRAAGA